MIRIAEESYETTQDEEEDDGDNNKADHMDTEMEIKYTEEHPDGTMVLSEYYKVCIIICKNYI